MIIFFKAKRVNNKIVFQKRFTTYIYFRFRDSIGKQRWWSQEWTNSNNFGMICFPQEGFLRSFSRVCAWFLYIEDDTNWHKLRYRVCDPSVPNQVLVHFLIFGFAWYEVSIPDSPAKSYLIWRKVLFPWCAEMELFAKCRSFCSFDIIVGIYFPGNWTREVYFLRSVETVVNFWVFTSPMLGLI